MVQSWAGVKVLVGGLYCFGGLLVDCLWMHVIKEVMS